MPKKKGGVTEVLETLKLLSLVERDILLENMAKEDPHLVALLKSKLYSISDLRYITPKMLVDFLRQVDIGIFALSLKLEDSEVVNEILSGVSSRVREDIENILQIKQPLKDVTEAQQSILTIMNKMIDGGSLVISKNDTYV